MTYALFGSFTAQPGSRDELVGYLLQAAEVLEGNPGCLQYVVSTSTDEDAVFVSEMWVDQAAHDASLEPQEIQEIIRQARPLIAGMSDQTHLTVRGGKGMPGWAGAASAVVQPPRAGGGRTARSHKRPASVRLPRRRLGAVTEREV